MTVETCRAAHAEVAGPTDIERFAAALATMPSATVLSHRSAAQLWGLWVPQFDLIEVTSPAGERGSRYTTSVQRQDIAAHRRMTAADDLTVRFGLPVTTVARTWLDLAALLDVHDLVAAGDSALRAGADRGELAARALASRRLRGSVRARTAAPLLDADSASRPESRIRAALVLSGLPKPEVNAPVFDEHGQWVATPDLLYREARIAIEFNGRDHATVQRMRKDATRLLDLQRLDWAVRTYTAIDAFSRLDQVVADMRTLLRRRAPQLLAAAASGVDSPVPRLR